MIQESIKELVDKQNNIIKQIEDLILNLPENDKIKVISDKPRIFILNFKDLRSENWTPEYYSFKTQYEAILHKFKQCKFENIIKVWEQIKKDRAVKVGTPTGYSKEYDLSIYQNNKFGRIYYRLHPEVIKNVDKVIYGE